MTLTVEQGDPHHPQATALLKQSHALMESLFSPEDNHYLEIDSLCVPEITFLVARQNDTIIGTAALANKGLYGEIKSMFVDPASRGSGAADALMVALDQAAHAQSLPVIKLETGSLLAAAHRLYVRHGFAKCGVFGNYLDNKSSLFMTKTL